MNQHGGENREEDAYYESIEKQAVYEAYANKGMTN